MILTPNQIAALIYFTGGWGPNAGATGANMVVNGQVQGRPPKNDPMRRQYEKFLDVAIAVCLAESGGDTLAKNATSSASGMWQILATTHAERIKQAAHYIFVEYDQPNGKTTVPNVFDPRVNSLVAKELWSAAGNSFKSWQAYTSGSYKQHLGHGKKAYLYITNKQNLQKERDALIANIMETQNYADLAGTVAGATIGNINPMNAVNNAINAAIGALKQSGITVGIFLIGVVLIILGAWFLLQRSSLGRSVSRGPIGLVTEAAKAAK